MRYLGIIDKKLETLRWMRDLFESITGYVQRWLSIILVIFIAACAEVPQRETSTFGETLGIHQNSITAVVFSQGGETVYSADSTGLIKKWDVSLASSVAIIPTRSSTVAFSPNGKVAVAVNRNNLKVVDLMSRWILNVFEVGLDGSTYTRNAYLSSDGTEALLIHQRGNVSTWNLVDGRPHQSFSRISVNTTTLYTAAFSPTDTLILLTHSRRPTVEIRNAETGELVRSFLAHEQGIRTSAFATHGQEVVTVGMDNSFKLWDLESGTLLARYDTSEVSGINRVVFSSNGKLIITGHNDGSMALWNVESRTMLKQFKAHDGWVESIAVSSDGKRLVSGGPDGIVKLWNLAEMLTE